MTKKLSPDRVAARDLRADLRAEAFKRGWDRAYNPFAVCPYTEGDLIQAYYVGRDTHRYGIDHRRAGGFKQDPITKSWDPEEIM